MFKSKTRNYKVTVDIKYAGIIQSTCKFIVHFFIVKNTVSISNYVNIPINLSNT